MRVALDSNVMIYAEGITDIARRALALSMVDAIRAQDLVIPLQAVGETLRWLVTKGGVSRPEAVERCSLWIAKYPVQETNRTVYDGACELISNHRYQVWDAVILSAAAEGGASVLLSEDMQEGFKWRGIIVANPFAAIRSPLIQSILDSKE
jgi:predicted nucleic acid-binding protein